MASCTTASGNVVFYPDYPQQEVAVVPSSEPSFWEVFLVYWDSRGQEVACSIVIHTETPEFAFAKALADNKIPLSQVFNHKIRKV